jgi:hypothetical protein
MNGYVTFSFSLQEFALMVLLAPDFQMGRSTRKWHLPCFLRALKLEVLCTQYCKESVCRFVSRELIFRSVLDSLEPLLGDSGVSISRAAVELQVSRM